MVNERIHEYSSQENRKLKWEEIIPVSNVLYLIAYLTFITREIEKLAENSEYNFKILFLLLELFGDLSSCIFESSALQKSVFDSNLVLLCIGKKDALFLLNSY